MRAKDSVIRDRKEAYRDARLIIIASEGKETEKIYFNALAKVFRNPRVHVKVLERREDEQHNSSPLHVMNQLNDYKDQYSLEADDELWLVIDKDRWSDALLSQVAQKCSQDCNMQMALSNPCFELWLLLHLVNAAKLSCEEQQRWLINRRKTKRSDPYLKVCLREEMGSYHESNYNAEALVINVKDAIARARELDINPDDRWPQTLGTRVYLLAESIIRDCREILRNF